MKSEHVCEPYHQNKNKTEIVADPEKHCRLELQNKVFILYSAAHYPTELLLYSDSCFHAYWCCYTNVLRYIDKTHRVSCVA